MRGQRLVLVEEAAIAHFESIVEFVGTGFLRRRVGCGKGNGAAVGLPCELLDRGLALGQLH